MIWLDGFKAIPTPQERVFVFGQNLYGVRVRPNEREDFVTLELHRIDGEEKRLIYTTKLCYSWPAVHAYIGEDFLRRTIVAIDPIDLRAELIFLHTDVSPKKLFAPIKLLEVMHDDLV